METGYIIPVPFAGTVLSTVTNGTVDLSGRLHNNRGADLTPAEYAHKRGMKESEIQVVNWEQLGHIIDQFQLDTYINAPAQVISFDRFMDFLEVLPPSNHKSTGDFERFNISERVTGSITTQVVRIGETCLSLYVDLCKKDTWVTPENFAEVYEQANPAAVPA